MKVRQECCRKLCGNCYTESEYIFVNDMGVPYQPNYVTQHFKLVLRKNHLQQYSLSRFETYLRFAAAEKWRTNEGYTGVAWTQQL